MRVKKIKIEKFYESFFSCPDCGSHSEDHVCTCGSYTYLIEQPDIEALEGAGFVIKSSEEGTDTLHHLVDGTIIREDEMGYTSILG